MTLEEHLLSIARAQAKLDKLDARKIQLMAELRDIENQLCGSGFETEVGMAWGRLRESLQPRVDELKLVL